MSGTSIPHSPRLPYSSVSAFLCYGNSLRCHSLTVLICYSFGTPCRFLSGCFTSCETLHFSGGRLLPQLLLGFGPYGNFCEKTNPHSARKRRDGCIVLAIFC